MGGRSAQWAAACTWRGHGCTAVRYARGDLGEANTGCVVKEELLEGGANLREVLDTEEGFKEGGRNELAAMQMLPGLWT